MTNKIVETELLGKMDLWNAFKTPPKSALKPIKAGRLKGKSDISPQWRYQVLTNQFGACGIGWKYEIVRVWNEPASDGQVMAFAQVNLFVKNDIDQWSDPIPGIGGSMFIAKEKSGLYSSDECYKMAVTDALSVACKMLGVAADVYLGLVSDSKYQLERKTPDQKPQSTTTENATVPQFKKLYALGFEQWPESPKDEVKTRVKEIAVWYRENDFLTKKEASELIKHWDEAVENFMVQAGQAPDGYGQENPDAKPPPYDNDDIPY